MIKEALIACMDKAGLDDDDDDDDERERECAAEQEKQKEKLMTGFICQHGPVFA